MKPELVILTLHVGIAVLFTAFGWPLWKRKIRPNWLYGFRTPATIRDERIWYPVNETAGQWMVGLGPLVAVVAATTYILELPIAQEAIINSIVMVGGLLVMTVRGFLQISQLKRELQ